MNENLQHFRIEQDPQGVVRVTLDVCGRPVNVFDQEVVAELEQIVEQLENNQTARLVVFRSGKASGFIAGADIRAIQQIESEDEAKSVIEFGQRLFDRIEQLPMPTVAVIHGPCLGGGLEFALACRHRLARDDSETRLGLPETQLGLIPAWGGTQRLPRLVGLTAAVRMILEGTKVTPSKAATSGLIDRSIHAEEFDAEVETFIDDRLAGKLRPVQQRGWKTWFLDRTWLGQWLVLRIARREIAGRGKDYPALPAALRAIETGLRHSHAAGLTVEREEFSRLLFSSTSRNLVELFFQSERARKCSTWVPQSSAAPRDAAAVVPRNLQRIAVLGAGTMGAGIAQLAAYSGFSVVLKDVNDELVDAGLQRIKSLMDDAVRKGALPREEAATRLQAITATSQWKPVDTVDLAIEAVVEREEIKREVFRELSERLSPEAILVSNTSSLPIDRLAQSTTHHERVAGLHFFNPVHKMRLVEIVHAAETSNQTIATLVEFVRRAGKVPVVVADSPGFLVNRILGPYFGEAVRLVCEGLPANKVDRQAVRFGMPMGPLELLDQVGLEVAADVAGSMMSSDISPTPIRLRAMVERGWLGKKSGRGFYTYHRGRRGRPTRWENPPIPSSHRTDLESHRSESTELTILQQRLMYPMLNEAVRCLEEHIVTAPWMVDLAMVLGTGFAPFRGGPLRMIDTCGVQNVVHDLEMLQQSFGSRFEPCELLRQMADKHTTFYESAEHGPGFIDAVAVTAAASH